MNRLRQQIKDETGAVIAEFVIVLPVVLLILMIALGSLAVQLERMKLVSVAAGLSRSVARGEPIDKVLAIYDLRGRTLAWKNTANSICAEVGLRVILPGLSGLPIAFSDTECARKLGL